MQIQSPTILLIIFFIPSISPKSINLIGNREELINTTNQIDNSNMPNNNNNNNFPDLLTNTANNNSVNNLNHTQAFDNNECDLINDYEFISDELIDLNSAADQNPIIKIQSPFSNINIGTNTNSISTGINYKVSLHFPAPTNNPPHSFIFDYWINYNNATNPSTSSLTYSQIKRRKRRHHHHHHHQDFHFNFHQPLSSPNDDFLISISQINQLNLIKCSNYNSNYGRYVYLENNSTAHSNKLFQFSLYIKRKQNQNNSNSNSSNLATNPFITLRLRYQKSSANHSSVVRHHQLEIRNLTIQPKDCSLPLSITDPILLTSSLLTNLTQLNHQNNVPTNLSCTITLLPSSNSGLQIQIQSLNIPTTTPISSLCPTAGGSLSITPILINNTAIKPPLITYCGKTGDYPLPQRTQTFNSIDLNQMNGISLIIHNIRNYNQQRGESFQLLIRPISGCEEIVLNSINSSEFYYKLNKDDDQVNCSIIIHVPYGLRIQWEMEMENVVYNKSIENVENNDTNTNNPNCDDANTITFSLTITDEYNEYLPQKLPHCTLNPFLSQSSLSNKLNLTFQTKASFKLSYKTVTIPELVLDCNDGWISLNDEGKVCVKLVEEFKPWDEAENQCEMKYNGTLVTVFNGNVQKKVQEIIKRSPLYDPSIGYWIGGNDIQAENQFQWASKILFNYTNWFPGILIPSSPLSPPLSPPLHSQHHHHHQQPNDDGLSSQDCIEMRSTFDQLSTNPNTKRHKNHHHHKTNLHQIENPSPNFYWNDMNCNQLNFFICEKRKEEVLQQYNGDGGDPSSSSSSSCNRTIYLNHSNINETMKFSSPGYPNPYPENSVCITNIHTDPGFLISIKFKEFSLEESEGCIYDSLEIIISSSPPSPSPPQLFCGLWSRKLKLLNYISPANSLSLKFKSDFSHQFKGYEGELRAVKDPSLSCKDSSPSMAVYGDSCYLALTSPPLNWNKAQQVCQEIKSTLSSVSSLPEWRFIAQLIVSKSSNPQKTNADSLSYWLGGYIDQSTNQLLWKDKANFNFSAFHPSDLKSISEWKCLSLYWNEESKSFAWKLKDCNMLQGFICKRRISTPHHPFPMPQKKTSYTSPTGHLTSPNYPHPYDNNLDYTVHLISQQPTNTMLLIKFQFMDIEYQDECLYDYLEIRESTQNKEMKGKRFCGTGFSKEELESLTYTSSSQSSSPNVTLHFHTDSSSSSSPNNPNTGFSLTWQFIDLSSCQSTKPLVANEITQTLYTPNFPHFHPFLNCSFHIVAEAGHRIYIHFETFEIGNNNNNNNCSTENHVSIELSPTKSIHLCGNLTSQLPTFISYTETMKIKLFSSHYNSNSHFQQKGFLAKYHSIPNNELTALPRLTIQIPPNTTIPMKSINFPHEPPENINSTFHFHTINNYIINITIFGKCNNASSQSQLIIINDPYSNKSTPTEIHLCGNSIAPNPPFHFQSSFNQIIITQIYHDNNPAAEEWGNLKLTSCLDPSYRSKLISSGDRLLLLNSCNPNPCENGGKCSEDGSGLGKFICKCQLPYTGPFCALTLCDMSPCLFGDCRIQGSSFHCNCQLGYGGEKCNRRSLPCDQKPCSGHGECTNTNVSNFKCNCHAFWEGPTCLSRITSIPFRPLSERMLKEPFWLGIITVTVVLGVIGLVWCLKRHFPEKLEKFLNEDLERKKGISWVSGRQSSMRLGCSSSSFTNHPHGLSLASYQGIPATSPQGSSSTKSFLGKFGIRKPSLLSLSSTTSVTAANTSPHSHSYESRTFSLDDLLRPSRSSMMRTPSPHRRRNFSIHGRRDPIEKQQILQQLVSSSASQSQSLDYPDGGSTSITSAQPKRPKPTIAEIIQMSEKRLRLASASSSINQENILNTPTTPNIINNNETSFNNTNITQVVPLTPTSSLTKAEKKVTFARLLDKLTAAEMSSSSSLSDELLSCNEDKTVAAAVQINLPEITTTTQIPLKKDDNNHRTGGRKTNRFRSKNKSYKHHQHHPRQSPSPYQDSATDQDYYNNIEISSSDTTPDPVYIPRFPTTTTTNTNANTKLLLCTSPTTTNKPPTKSLTKIASADSLLALFRRFSGTGSSSAPPSPQYSENEESSIGPGTPLSTPSSPRNSALSLNFRPPPAFLITSAIGPSSNNDQTNDPINDQTNINQTPWRPQSQQNLQMTSNNPTQSCLDVPMLRDYCLSPIHEVPTPLPTPGHSPAHSPLIQQLRNSPNKITTIPDIQVHSVYEEEDQILGLGGGPIINIPKISISIEDSSDSRTAPINPDDPNNDVFLENDSDSNNREVSVVIPDVLIHVRPQEQQQQQATTTSRFTFDPNTIMRIDPTYSPITSPTTTNSEPSRRPTKTKPPPLIFANEILSSPNNSPRGNVRTQEASPSITQTTTTTSQGETHDDQNDPKNSQASPNITLYPALLSYTTANNPMKNMILPLITINQNQSEEEEGEYDDSETNKFTYLSSNKSNLGIFLNGPNNSNNNNDTFAALSESNLSTTSGYSSMMASPCHSRCPSTSPLLAGTEKDEDDEEHKRIINIRRTSLGTGNRKLHSNNDDMPRRASLNNTANPSQISNPISKQEEEESSGIMKQQAEMETGGSNHTLPPITTNIPPNLRDDDDESSPISDLITTVYSETSEDEGDEEEELYCYDEVEEEYEEDWSTSSPTTPSNKSTPINSTPNQLPIQTPSSSHQINQNRKRQCTKTRRMRRRRMFSNSRIEDGNLISRKEEEEDGNLDLRDDAKTGLGNKEKKKKKSLLAKTNISIDTATTPSPKRKQQQRKLRAQTNLDDGGGSSPSSSITSPNSQRTNPNKPELIPSTNDKDNQATLSIVKDKDQETIPTNKPAQSTSKLRTIALQIRFLRRLEKSLIRKRESIAAGSTANTHPHRPIKTNIILSSTSSDSLSSNSSSSCTSSSSCSSCSITNSSSSSSPSLSELHAVHHPLK